MAGLGREHTGVTVDIFWPVCIFFGIVSLAVVVCWGTEAIDCRQSGRPATLCRTLLSIWSIGLYSNLTGNSAGPEEE